MIEDDKKSIVNKPPAGRQGKHKDGKTLLGAYVSVEVKALAVMTSEHTGMSMTEIILEGINLVARRAQLSDLNGNVLPQHLNEFRMVREMCILKRKERKQK